MRSAQSGHRRVEDHVNPSAIGCPAHQRIRHLQQLRNELTDCIGCGCMSIDRRALINPDDVLGAQGPGPRRLLAVPSPQSRRGAAMGEC